MSAHFETIFRNQFTHFGFEKGDHFCGRITKSSRINLNQFGTKDAMTCECPRFRIDSDVRFSFKLKNPPIRALAIL